MLSCIFLPMEKGDLKEKHLSLNFWNEFSSGQLELKGFVLLNKTDHTPGLSHL
jgi:hypothetical protein